jgi:hypothetical protein
VENEQFSDADCEELSIRAVNELIGIVERKCLSQSVELAEAIANCIRYSATVKLQVLKAVLDGREASGKQTANAKKPRWEN